MLNCSLYTTVVRCKAFWIGYLTSTFRTKWELGTYQWLSCQISTILILSDHNKFPCELDIITLRYIHMCWRSLNTAVKTFLLGRAMRFSTWEKLGQRLNLSFSSPKTEMNFPLLNSPSARRTITTYAENTSCNTKEPSFIPPVCKSLKSGN